MRIRWLHLSDIHFNFKNYDSHSLRQDFLKRIETLSHVEPFTHLFITGDILYCNNKADEGTIKFIKDLITIMNVDKDQVIIVPGNHDHNRNVSITVLEELYSSKKDKPQYQIIDELNNKNCTLEELDKYKNRKKSIYDWYKYSNQFLEKVSAKS